MHRMKWIQETTLINLLLNTLTLCIARMEVWLMDQGQKEGRVEI